MKTIPANIQRALSPAGRKLWLKFYDTASQIDTRLQIHFAAYCNSRAEYETCVAKIDDMEKKGEDSLVKEHDNGTFGMHPIRTILDKARRAMADELRRCGLSYDKLDGGVSQEEGDPFDG